MDKLKVLLLGWECNGILKRMSKVILVFLVAMLLVIPSNPVNASSDAKVVTWNDAPATGTILENNTIYKIGRSFNINSSKTANNGLKVADGATVSIYIPKDITLNVYGGNASGQKGGYAGIYVPSNATLIITGSGTINAYGGNAANGGNGLQGGSAYESSGVIHPGYGGAGGYGGGGAGAGIGTNGGNGGNGGSLASEYSTGGHGQNGWPGSQNYNGGSSGASSQNSGDIYKVGKPIINGFGGNTASGGYGGAGGTWSIHTMPNGVYRYGGAGGGGGGGGGGYAAAGVGTGGGGAGGGGGGSTGGVTDREGSRTPRTVCGTGGNGGGGFGSRGNPGNNDNGNEWRYGTSYDGGATNGGTSNSRGSGEAWNNTTVYAGYPGYGGNRAAAGTTKTVTQLSTHSMLQYIVTLDNAGADVVDGTRTITATLGASMPNIPIFPQKKGYDFEGFWSQQNGVGDPYYDKNGISLSEWNYTEDITLYAKWKNTLFAYNTPSSIRENNLNASVTYNPANKAEYESQVGATVALNGIAEKSGMHVVHLVSDTLGSDFDISIIVQVPKAGVVNEMQSKTFKVPAQDITDMKLTHEFIPMPDVYNQTYNYDNTKKPYSIPSSFNKITVGELQYEELGTGNISTTAPKNVGEYTVSIPLTISGSPKTIYLTKQLTILPKLLEWDVSDLKASDKEYNGNADAKVEGKIKVKGILLGDDVSLSNATISKGSFDTPMAEKSKLISVDVSNVSLTGSDAKNYALSTIAPTLRADITGIEPSIIIKNGSPENTYNGRMQVVDDLVDFTDPNVKEVILDGENELNLHYMYYTNNACTSVTTSEHGASEDGGAPANAGNYWVRVTYTPDESQAQYSSMVSSPIPYIINPKMIHASASWTANQDGYVYNGDNISHEFLNAQLKPKLDVYEDTTGSLKLEEDRDYRIVYDDNVLVGEHAKAKIELKGNYKGSVEKEFAITKATYDMTPVTMSNQTYSYDKRAHNVTIDDIYALLKIDTNLSVSYTYEGKNGTVYDKSANAPSEKGIYTVTATITTSSPNWKFQGANEDSYEITSTLNIVYTNKKITFDLNGGNISGSQNTVVWNDAPQYKKMSDYPGGVPKPTLDGYELSAWESDGILYSGTKINDEEIQSNRTYKAVWVEKKVAVNFDANDGLFQDGKTIKKYEQPFNSEFEFGKVAIPTNAHRKFKGWGSTADATTPLNGIFKFDDISADGKTYYAIWETETYDVTLHYNGGMNTADKEQALVKVLFGGTIGTIEEPKITNKDTTFTFKGWMNPNAALKDDGSEKLYSTSELESFQPTKDTIFIAVWDGDTIDLQFDKFDKNDGSVTYTVPKLSTGVKAASPKPVSNKGNIFKNWKVTASSDTNITVGETYKENEIFDLAIKNNVTFVAEYQLETYDIKFDLNTGILVSGDIDQTIQYNKSPTEVKAKKEGYVLSQWLDMATGNYIKASELTTQQIQSDTVYVAQWKEDIKMITLDANGGTPDKKVQIKKGDTFDIDNIAHPSKKNTNFVGWASTLDKANNGDVDVKGNVTITDDVTYYAVWNDVKYNVRFQNANGSVIKELEILKDATIESVFLGEPVSEQVEGSTFKGWKQGGDTTLKQWKDIRIQQVDQPLTFTASFDVNTYRLTFDVNGGSDGPDTLDEAYGKEILLGDYKAPKAPAGYQFAGWYDQPKGGTLLAKHTFTKDKTIYARYVTGEASYTIEYYEKNLDGSTYDLAKKETVKGTTDSSIVVNPAERVGFHNEAGKTMYESSSELNSADPLPIKGDGSLKVKLYYERNEYEVSYTTEGNSSADIPSDYNATYLYGEEVEIKPYLQSDGYGFEGWYSNGITILNNRFKMPAGNVELHGKFNANLYMVRYELESETGSSIVDNTKYQVGDEVSLTKTIPEKEGYHFAGWKSEDVSLKGRATFFSMPAQDVKISATWEKDTYELTFDSKGGNDIEVIQGIKNETVTLPSAPIKPGFQFVGWLCDDALYSEGASYVILSTGKVFEAQWKSAEYNITYKLDEGVFNKAVRTTYNYGDEFILDEPKRDGYIFEGWFEDEELLRNKSNIMKTDEQDFTLYAKWSEAVKETYDVIYHSNDGKTHKKATYSKGEQDLLIPSLRNDFVFDGWYLESDFVTKVENLSGKDVEEVELYAKWVPYEKITEVPENKENTSSSVTSKENKETQSPKVEVKEEKKENKETEKKQDKVVVKETVQKGIPWWTLLIAVFGGALIPIIYIKRKGYNNKT